MAEGFARKLAPQDVRIHSAGTEPKTIHPLAVQVMKEVGIDISRQRSKGLEAIPLDKIDLVVTLCGEAAEHCPALATNTERLHWPLPDPAQANRNDETVLRIFREVRDEIRSRVKDLFEESVSSKTGERTKA
jgi:arsenate reductase